MHLSLLVAYDRRHSDDTGGDTRGNAPREGRRDATGATLDCGTDVRRAARVKAAMGCERKQNSD